MKKYHYINQLEQKYSRLETEMEILIKQQNKHSQESVKQKQEIANLNYRLEQVRLEVEKERNTSLRLRERNKELNNKNQDLRKKNCRLVTEKTNLTNNYKEQQQSLLNQQSLNQTGRDLSEKRIDQLSQQIEIQEGEIARLNNFFNYQDIAENESPAEEDKLDLLESNNNSFSSSVSSLFDELKAAEEVKVKPKISFLEKVEQAENEAWDAFIETNKNNSLPNLFALQAYAGRWFLNLIKK